MLKILKKTRNELVIRCKTYVVCTTNSLGISNPKNIHKYANENWRRI